MLAASEEAQRRILAQTAILDAEKISVFRD